MNNVNFLQYSASSINIFYSVLWCEKKNKVDKKIGASNWGLVS